MSVDLQFLKTRANFIRFSFIEEMEKHLLDFESKLSSKNFIVRWIGGEAELVEFISNTLPKKNYNKICFDIPKIPDSFFERKNFIKQISVENFENNIDTAEHLIIQADFGIVENGTIIFTNKQSKNCFNNIENIFIILNINDLVIRQTDLEVLLHLKREINNIFQHDDIKIISAPPSRIINKKFHMSDEGNFFSETVEVFVLLYDNYVTEILEDNLLRESLYCINCGKCKEVCPVYKQTNLLSPIDLVKYHSKKGNFNNVQLFENTILCGNCKETCPVQINFTQLFINQMSFFTKRSKLHEKSIDLYKNLSKRSKMNRINSKIRRYFFVKKYFGKNKKLSNYLSNCTENFFNIQQIKQQ